MRLTDSETETNRLGRVQENHTAASGRAHCPRLVGVAVLMATLAAAPSAHYPLLVDDLSSPDRAEVIDDVGRARAFFGRLEQGQVDYFHFDGASEQSVTFEILVPQRDELRGFRPELTIAGPGLTDDCGDLPMEADGCRRVPSSSTPARVYEGYTQSYYWSYAATGEPNSTVNLPADGSFLVAVRADDDESEGPYALGFGNEQRFGVTEVLGFPLQWVSARLWYFS